MSETNGKPRKQDAEPNQRRRLPEWLAVRLDLPPDILSGGMRAELRGRNLLTVQGCRRILTYTPTCIRLQMKDTVLAVRGRRLGCTSYLAGAVGVDRWRAFPLRTGERGWRNAEHVSAGVAPGARTDWLCGAVSGALPPCGLSVYTFYLYG